jgi:hypothetical protein
MTGGVSFFMGFCLVLVWTGLVQLAMHAIDWAYRQ